MKKKSKALHGSLLPLSVLVLFFAVASSSAGELEERIKALEEVQRANAEELARLKGEQMEFRKDAQAAAEAVPKFRYRAGDGMTISAADESWQFNLSWRIHIFIYNTVDGRPNFSEAGTPRATGTDRFELFPRRNRLFFNFCWDDCFWEFQHSFEAEQAPRNTLVRDNEIIAHFEKWNPYLPFFSFGLRRGAGRTFITRSSSNDAVSEHMTTLAGFGWGTTGSHSGAGLGWDRVPLWTGDFQLFLNWASSRQGTHQEFGATDRSGMLGYVGGRPFSQLKQQKFLRGMEFGFGWQFHSLDDPTKLPEDDSGAIEIRVRTHERRGRLELFRPAAIPNLVGDESGQNVGGGFAYVLIPNFKWVIGPYMFRTAWFTTRYKGEDDGIGGVWARGWQVVNELFVWSPKGFLTGSPSTPHSILVGWQFERGDMSCGVGCDASPGSGSFHNQRIINRELGVYYFIRRGMRVGTWWHWWDTANTPRRTQIASGCVNDTEGFLNRGPNNNKRVGKGCDWHSVNLGFQLTW